MFSWATQQLENLAQTVAPPPTDANSRFVYFSQRRDEVSAQSCLAEIDPLTTVVQPSKGAYPLHLACQFNMNAIVRQIMEIPGANVHVMDYSGNTALHYACLSEDKSSMDTVRLLVTQFGASVVAKNLNGQTPYDLASINSVRQYLLPLQLQQETREALDNGGIGLPPGIDMGGLQIRNSNLPPPPFSGMSGHPPSTPGPDPTTYGIMATPSPSVPAKYPMQTSTSGPAMPPPAPTSGPHSYSRTGHSSAAIFSTKYKSDGFHSSSSDVNLQIKYGHSSSGNLASAVPPPPSSGNMTSASAPPSSGFAGAANPYAAFGGGAMKARYPVYNTNPGIPQASAPMSGGYNFTVTPPAPGNYTMFNPVVGAAQQDMNFQQQPARQALSPRGYQQPQAAPFIQPGHLPPISAPTTPASPFLPPPPLSSMAQTQQQSAFPQSSCQPQQSANSPYGNGGAQSLFLAQPEQALVNASPYLDGAPPQKSLATGNAQQLFSSEPALVSGNAQLLFSTPATPVSGSDKEIFGSPAPECEQTSNVRTSMSRAQPMEQSTTVVSTTTADALLGTPSPANASTIQPEAQLAPISSGSAPPEQLKQDAASIFATPIGHAGRGVREVSQDMAPSPAPNDTMLNAPAPEQIIATLQPEQPLSKDIFGTQLHAASYTRVIEAPGEVREISDTQDSDDGMIDVPLSPKDQPQSTTPSMRQATVPAPANSAAALFGSIGMPPPPFSYKQ